MLQYRVFGGSLLEVLFYAFEFSGQQGSPEWITQWANVEVPPGGARLVASVAGWRVDFGSVQHAVGITAQADPATFPQIAVSVLVSAFDPANPTVQAANPWYAWVNVQVLVFA